MQVLVPQHAFFISMTKKLLAQKLRSEGLSLGDIAKRLNMQKSGSISRWCKDITLSDDLKEQIFLKGKERSKKGRLIAIQKIKDKKANEIETLRAEGISEVGKIARKELFVSGILAYWCEGYKYKGGDQVGFVNSDFRLIQLMIRWFKESCNIPIEKFAAQIKINQVHQHRLEDIKKYWQKITGFLPSQFNKTVFLKTDYKRIYTNSENYFGTLRVTVKNSTKLRRKINGWIEGVARNIV